MAGIANQRGSTGAGRLLVAASDSDEQEARLHGFDAAAKRALDVIVSGIVLLVAIPVFLLIALAIVADSPGPVFHRVERVGWRGRPLRMLKFRKMRQDAHGAPLTIENDGRLTRVGRLLVRTRLDELPQLWHVLRGEMSLVGPRPEDVAFVAARAADYEEILSVRPGMAGITQLAFADESRILSDVDPIRDYVEHLLPQKCALDRLYLGASSLSMDLRILAWTLIAVILRRPVAVDRSTGALHIRRRPAAIG